MYKTYILIFYFLLSSCKSNTNHNLKSESNSSKIDSEKEFVSGKDNTDTIDYYWELSNEESKLLNATYKVNCIKNNKDKRYPALIGLHPISEFYIDLFNNVELARIIASTYKKNDIDSVYYLKYSMLTGITRYNQQLNWHKISRDSIIAKIELTDNKKLKLWWYGLYDTEQKKWVHAKSDFNLIGGDNPVLLQECEED